MDFLEPLPPGFASLSNHLPTLFYCLEKTEQRSPLPAFKKDGLRRVRPSEDLIIIDPAEVSPVEVTVSYLELGPVAHRSFFRGIGNLFMGGDLPEEFAPVL